MKIEFISEDKIPEGAKLVDAFSGGLKELFVLNNPSCKDETPENKAKFEEFLKIDLPTPVYAYYPFRNTVIKTFPEEIYTLLRTARNQLVISKEEQEKYRASLVGVAGLSVGSAVISSLVISGGPKRLKVADFDVLEITNLNRVHATLLDIGSPKSEVSARRVLELDPFAEIEVFKDGVNAENIGTFILDPKLDVFVDEMDSIPMKIEARFIAKKNKVPVVMATDNGDGILLDVERFDQEPERPIFHGLVEGIEKEDLKNLPFKRWLVLATKIVGPEYLTDRMRESILSIGKKISSVPQIGTSAMLAGSAVSFVIRRIASGQKMPSGRYKISFEEHLDSDYLSEDSIRAREESLKSFFSKISGNG